MEIKASTVVAVFAASMLMLQTLALPMGAQDSQGDQSAEKRPKYMDTRDMSYFKDLFMYTLGQLIEDGQISVDVLANKSQANEDIVAEQAAPAKRGRSHLGFCVHVTASGSYFARPCWKSHGRR